MVELMELRTLYKWIALYMLLSIPMGIARSVQGLESTIFIGAYIVMASLKIVLCLCFLEKAGLNASKKLLTVGLAVILRLLFHAPWFALCIASVLFHSNKTKKPI